jgi:ribosome-associated protein
LILVTKSLKPDHFHPDKQQSKHQPMKTFELSGKDYIELNKLLKLLNLVETGGEAHLRIDAGEVKVNETVERRRRKKLRSGDIVLFNKETIRIV